MLYYIFIFMIITFYGCNYVKHALKAGFISEKKATTIFLKKIVFKGKGRRPFNALHA